MPTAYTAAIKSADSYTHNVGVHSPELHTCRNVVVRSLSLSLSLLSSYIQRFSTVLHATRCVDNRREITLRLVVKRLIPMKYEILASGEDI